MYFHLQDWVFESYLAMVKVFLGSCDNNLYHISSSSYTFATHKFILACTRDAQCKKFFLIFSLCLDKCLDDVQPFRLSCGFRSCFTER